MTDGELIFICRLGGFACLLLGAFWFADPYPWPTAKNAWLLRMVAVHGPYAPAIVFTGIGVVLIVAAAILRKRARRNAGNG